MLARENLDATCATPTPARRQPAAIAPDVAPADPAQMRRPPADALGAALARVVGGRSLITSDNEEYEPPEGAVSSSLLDAPRRVGGRGIDTIRSWITNVKGTVTPRDNFAGRSNSRYGVGEIIDLAHQGPHNAAYYGGLRWKIDSGGGTIVAPTDGTAVYTCPRKPGIVNLELEVVTGNTQGDDAGDTVATQTIQVVGIEDAWMERDTAQGLWHRQGYASVGFKGDIFFGPKDVSFQWARMKEGTGTGKATGFLKAKGKDGEVHAATPTWVTIGGGDVNRGSKLGGTDTVSTGQYGPIQDKHGNNVFTHGVFNWPIPWYYEGPGGSERKIKTVTHHEHVHADGSADIRKAGSGTFTKQLNDPDSDY